MRNEPSYDEYNKLYTDTYNSRIYGNSLSGRCMQRSHQVLEKILPQGNYAEVLEVGGGTKGHLQYITHPFEKYYFTDRYQHSLDIAKDSVPEHLKGKVEFHVQDALQLTYPDDRFDRVIACHILEHVPEPHKALREWHRVVKPGGTLSVVIPCDPGLLYRAGQCVGPRRAAEKSGIPYDYWASREHINPIDNLYSFLRYYFPEHRGTFWPTGIRSIDLNLFYICNIVKQK